MLLSVILRCNVGSFAPPAIQRLPWRGYLSLPRGLPSTLRKAWNRGMSYNNDEQNKNIFETNMV